MIKNGKTLHDSAKSYFKKSTSYLLSKALCYRGVAPANIVATDFNPLKTMQPMVKNLRFGQYNRRLCYMVCRRIAILTLDGSYDMSRAHGTQS